MGWWRRFFRQSRLERELDAELRDHVEREVADLDHLSGRHHREPVAQVLELAHVAGKGEARQMRQRGLRQALIEALKMSNWVQKDAAELLSISPRVMNYKIKTLGIDYSRGRRPMVEQLV